MPTTTFVRILKWNEAEHPRQQQGSTAGQFIASGGTNAAPAGEGLVPARERRRGNRASVEVTTVDNERISIDTTKEGKAWIDAHRRGLQKQHEGLPGGKINPIACGDDLEQAQRLIGMGLHVTLNQPDQVSTLVNKIATDVMAAEAKSKATGVKVKMPVFNIAGISVKGTNLFAQDNLDIDRVNMPQVSGIPIPGSKADALPKNSRGGVDLTDQFLQSLANDGIASKEEHRLASHLRATQDGMDGGKVGGIAKAMRDGTMEDGVITVTRDHYVLDGHHRWAATIVNDVMDNKAGDLTMPVKVLDIDIGTALSKARQFQEDWGIPVAKLGQKKDFAVGETAFSFGRVQKLDAPKKKKKFKKIQGMQDVPMDCDAISASFSKANS